MATVAFLMWREILSEGNIVRRISSPKLYKSTLPVRSYIFVDSATWRVSKDPKSGIFKFANHKIINPVSINASEIPNFKNIKTFFFWCFVMFTILAYRRRGIVLVMNVVTDEKKIEEVLTRGVEHIYPSNAFLKKRLLNGKQLTLYLGIDPTGPTLHIGYAVVLRKLRQLQNLGHKIILLIGDFTALIGDPTDKSATRVKQTREQVLENAKLYKDQAAHFLDFEGDNAVEIKYNSDWLSKMNFADVLELASTSTVQQMLERDMFEKRIAENKPIYTHEFFYPLMQGYDAVAMNVDGELGGNDQTFNMLMGRTLQKTLKNKEMFVVSMKLLVDPTVKKMGKTEGNMVSFLDTPTDAFGKIMSWPDTLMPLGYELCTDVDMPGTEPMESKLSLAENIVSSYWGKIIATKARQDFSTTFSKGEMPENILEIKSNPEQLLSDFLLEQKLVASKNEFRRLVTEGAISIDGEKISDYNFQAKNGVVRVGKHRFIKIKVKN